MTLNSNLSANKKRLLESPSNEPIIFQTRVKWGVTDSTNRQDKSHSIQISTKAALDQTLMTISTRSRIYIVGQVPNRRLMAEPLLSLGADLQGTLDKSYTVKLPS